MTFQTSDSAERRELDQFLGGAPIFYQPWWLEAVSPGNWDYVVARRDSHIAAVLPYVWRRCRLGQISLGMPRLTQTLGPWLGPASQGNGETVEEQQELLLQLIDRLPEHGIFKQDFHYTVTNWLPFHWKGFEQSTRYDYVLENPADTTALWKHLEKDVCRVIRRTREQLDVRDDLGLESLMRVRDMSIERLGVDCAYSMEFMHRVDAACASRGARKMLFAVDSLGRIHAVLYLVWTEYALYPIIGGSDPRLRTSQAYSLVFWEAIRFAGKVAQRFDFEMATPSPPIERFFRRFGGTLVPYFRVERASDPICGACWKLRTRVLARIRHPLLRKARGLIGRSLRSTEAGN